MAICGEQHKHLTNGNGKCSVPMWCMGVPAGFCDKNAYGTPEDTDDHPGKYAGYVPYLACPAHGGPSCPGRADDEGRR